MRAVQVSSVQKVLEDKLMSINGSNEYLIFKQKTEMIAKNSNK